MKTKIKPFKPLKNAGVSVTPNPLAKLPQRGAKIALARNLKAGCANGKRK
jgi:hypothetical protein